MPQNEYIPQSYEVDDTFTESASALYLRSSKRSRRPIKFTFETLRPGLFRTTFTSPEHPLPPHPSVPRPAATATTNGYHTEHSAFSTSKTIRNRDVIATVSWEDVPIVSLQFDDSKEVLHADLPNRSYVLDGPGVARYTCYKRNTLHVGLGEKAAPMNLSNRKFAIDATDCFGYNTHLTDPMYKHMPLLINATPQGCVATFSSSHSRGSYSIGAEMDGLWGHYKVRYIRLNMSQIY